MTENSSKYNSKNRAAPPNVSTILKSHINRELTKAFIKKYNKTKYFLCSYQYSSISRSLKISSISSECAITNESLLPKTNFFKVLEVAHFAKLNS